MVPIKLTCWTATIALLLSTPGCVVGEKIHPKPNLFSAFERKDDSYEVPSEKLFPDDIGWIDIKKDYGAKGDGKTDDTDAIMRAIDDSYADYTRPTLIYFPKGTYLVRDTLKWSEGRYNCCITFQGQEQDSTIIKLKDNAPGFENREKPKPVIVTKQGNEAFHHYIRDLTINTGSGNQAAMGVDYISSNRGAITNVTIKSEDGEGKAGIDMTRIWPGPSLLKNLTIEGFDYGIKVARVEYSLTLENITLKNQKIAGIFNKQNTLAIRNLKSNNSVPAIHNSAAGLVILIDGDFQGGSSLVSAIDNNAYLYARNIVAKGYKSAISHKGNVLPGLSTTEYISHQVYSLFDSSKQSLQLPIEETPSFHDNNLDNWANAKDYPSIQAAMNSGKSTIYFPSGNYEVTGTINIPPTVRKIVGFESFINLDRDDLKVVFRIKENSDYPLIIESLNLQGVTIEHAAPRTIAIKHSKLKQTSNDPGQVWRNSLGAGKLFLEDVQMFVHLDYPQNVWARQLNPESRHVPATKVLNKGGNLWILGIKVEGTGTVMETNNGGKTEILGNLLYPGKDFSEQVKQQPAFINRESSMSLIYSYSFYTENQNYSTQIEETRNEETKSFSTEEMPGRVMPLFTGFKNR